MISSHINCHIFLITISPRYFLLCYLSDMKQLIVNKKSEECEAKFLTVCEECLLFTFIYIIKMCSGIERNLQSAHFSLKFGQLFLWSTKWKLRVKSCGYHSNDYAYFTIGSKLSEQQWEKVPSFSEGWEISPNNLLLKLVHPQQIELGPHLESLITITHGAPD